MKNIITLLAVTLFAVMLTVGCDNVMESNPPSASVLTPHMGHTSCILSWTECSTPELFSVYEIYWSEWEWETNPAVDPQYRATNYEVEDTLSSVAGLSYGYTYYFVIRTVGPGGEAWSNIVSHTPQR